MIPDEVRRLCGTALWDRLRCPFLKFIRTVISPASEYNENYRDNPWIASTQTGYRQNWTNQIQTNVTLNQKLDFITEGLKFIGRFGYDTNNSNYINKLKAPERWKAERFRDSEGNLVFKRLNEEQKDDTKCREVVATAMNSLRQSCIITVFSTNIIM